jgi:type II secretory pathway pseudopilin PulG
MIFAPFHRRTQNRGFTLAELLVYIGIMTLALAAIVVLLVNATTIVRRVQESNDVRTSAIVSLERIGREAKRAISVSTAESTLGVHPGVLAFHSRDDAGNLLHVRFAPDGAGGLAIFYNGVSRGSLVSSSVSVNEIIFHRTHNIRSESVRIRLTLSHRNAPERPVTFHASAVLRGSY